MRPSKNRTILEGYRDSSCYYAVLKNTSDYFAITLVHLTSSMRLTIGELALVGTVIAIYHLSYKRTFINPSYVPSNAIPC